jgi:spore maturation protein SpmA
MAAHIFRPATQAGLARVRVVSGIGGAVAQLGERYVRNVEVVGSIPISSTTFLCFFSSLMHVSPQCGLVAAHVRLAGLLLKLLRRSVHDLRHEATTLYF